VAAERQRPRRRRGRARRAFAILAILALVGAGITVAVVSSMTDNQRVHLRKVVYSDVNQAADALRQLVNDNTR
jgi:uncharacterized protein (UPF0333 family)